MIYRKNKNKNNKFRNYLYNNCNNFTYEYFYLNIFLYKFKKLLQLFPLGNLYINFLNKETMIKTNNFFFQHNYLTDVLTFSGNKLINFAGEICISPDCAILYCIKNNKITHNNISKEIILYLTHGLLHLCKYNDNNNKLKKIMIKKQNNIIKYLLNIKLNFIFNMFKYKI